jgi:creatine kinase
MFGGKRAKEIQYLQPYTQQNYPPYGLSPTVTHLPDWIKAGCGNAEYYSNENGATFPGHECPEVCPNLTDHQSIAAKILKSNPGMYDKYKHKKTSLGVSLAKCIKTGIDNKGHPHIEICGLVAGDEESFEVFSDIFDKVIEQRHNGYARDAKHPTDLDLSKVSKRKLDPTGKYVMTSRVRTGRSIKGTRLPPACSFEERRQLEKVIVKGLKSLKGDLKGDYFPLAGSMSYESKPGGMTKDKEEELRDAGNLFQEPDSTLLLSSGCGRHWPDARGIYHNDAANSFVWVNEEDHMRIVSMEKGDDIQKVFARFVNICDGVREVLSKDGSDFMHNDHLGYILTCPSNCGTGLRAGSLVKIPLVSSRTDFKDILKRRKLQARGQGGVDCAAKGGVFDISNADRLGTSEVDLVNIMINGVADLVEWEQMLEKGKSIDHLVNK